MVDVAVSLTNMTKERNVYVLSLVFNSERQQFVIDRLFRRGFTVFRVVNLGKRIGYRSIFPRFAFY